MRRLIVAAALLGCSEDGKSGQVDDAGLLQVSRFLLEAVDAPSGLTYADGRLYVVGDKKAKVYVFTTFGVPVDTIELDDVDDDQQETFEAVAADGETLVLAREAAGEVYRVSADDGEVTRRIIVRGVADGNDGLEGLCVRPTDHHIFAVKEKKPTELVELTPNGEEVGRVSIDFAPDLSGLENLGLADCPEQILAVSQEAKRLYQLRDSGELLGEWAIDAARAEGVAYTGGRLYVVDEEAAALLVFAFEGKCL